jgi:hypothetical protein
VADLRRVGAGVEAVVDGAAVVTRGAGAGALEAGGLGVTGNGVGEVDVAVACETRRCGLALGLGAAGVRACAGADVVAGARPEVTDNGSPARPTRVAAS